jgi:hypothetical protein
MRARPVLCAVATLGLMALCLSGGARPVLSAAQSCGGRHDVAFASTSDSAAQAMVVAIACATARARGLTARSPVAARLVDANTLRAEVARISQAAAQPVAGTTVALQLLGALKPREDLAAIQRAQYNLDTAAQYDYRSHVLFVRGGNGRYTPLDRAIIAHEYARALQDQYFNLAALIAPSTAGTRNSDALLARQAVVEGDDITTMVAVATATLSRQDLIWLNQQLQRPTSTASDFAHDLYSFPATQGTAFVRYIMQAAAKGKRGDAAQAAGDAAVNEALKNPPTATIQVLNPALYLQHASPGDPSPPLPTLDLGPGWSAVDSDVLGSFGISDLLGDRAPQPAAQAGAQWQGDRWMVYQHGSDTILVWRARFTGSAGAQAFLRGLVSYTAARFHASLTPRPSFDWHTSGYAMSAREQGVAVAVALSSNTDLLSVCAHAADLLSAS